MRGSHLVVLSTLLIASCGPRPVLICDGYGRRSVPPDAARGVPGYVEYMDCWCNGYRVVPDPIVRPSHVPNVSRELGGIALLGVLEDGTIGTHVIGEALIVLAKDSLMSDTVDVHRAIDRQPEVTFAPEGTYWLSVRRIGFYPVLARVQIRAGMLDTVIVPVAQWRIC